MNRLLPSLRTAGAARAPALIQRPPLQPSRLEQCLLLAVLLHILLVLALGNAPGGTAAPGEGVWGRLNVTLRASLDLRRGDEAGGGPPAPPELNIGPTGPAKPQRYGGAVRREAAPRPPADTPGAAQLGQWQAQPQTAPVLPQPPLIEPVPVLAPETPPDSPPTTMRSLAPLPATPLQRLAPALLSAAPAPAAPAVEALPVLPTIRSKRAPAEPPGSLAAPVLPVAGETLHALPAFEPPLPAAAALPAPEAAKPETPPQPAAAVPTPTPATPAPSASPSAAAAPTAPSPNASSNAPPVRAGAPDAGARVGHDVATPPSTPPSAPRLNLNLPLPRGGPLSSRGSPGALPLLPHPPELKSKLAEEMEKAGSSDCRKAYSEMGVLAVVPLAADALRNKGCRW